MDFYRAGMDLYGADMDLYLADMVLYRANLVLYRTDLRVGLSNIPVFFFTLAHLAHPGAARGSRPEEKHKNSRFLKVFRIVFQTTTAQSC